MKNVDKMSARELRNEVRTLRELRKQVDVSAGLECPSCENVGWYAEATHQGWEQVQCEFCWTVPDSIFSRISGQFSK
jgi:hypothetical protein